MGPRGLTASRAPRPFLEGEDFRAAETGRPGKGSVLGWPQIPWLPGGNLSSFTVYVLCSILHACTRGWVQPSLPAPPNALLLGLCELVTCVPSGPRASDQGSLELA